MIPTSPRQATEGRRNFGARPGTVSASVAEEEITGIGADNMLGHLVAWNYFQTTETPENEKFVQAFKTKYGDHRVTDDPIEAGYFGVYLWANAVAKANSSDVATVKEAGKGLQYNAPGGVVTIHNQNQHVARTVRFGEVREDGQINETLFLQWRPAGLVRVRGR